MSESVAAATPYVLANAGGTQLYVIENGTASLSSATTFRTSTANANNGVLWTYANGTFTLANSTISVSAINDLSASIHDDNYLKYTIDGSDYYLYNYKESSHGYRATFVPSNVSNLICSYTK